MLRLFCAVSLAVLLSGCATQFGTRIAHPFHHKAVVSAPAPAVVVPVVAPVVAPAPVAPVKKLTLRQRILSKIIRKRAK